MIPSVQFAGVITPVASLEGVGALIGRINPSTYFLNISRGVFNKALGLSSVWPAFVPVIVAALVVVGLSIAMLHKQER
jgi:ribosome-dependent ATPase